MGTLDCPPNHSRTSAGIAERPTSSSFARCHLAAGAPVLGPIGALEVAETGVGGAEAVLQLDTLAAQDELVPGVVQKPHRPNERSTLDPGIRSRSVVPNRVRGQLPIGIVCKALAVQTWVGNGAQP